MEQGSDNATNVHGLCWEAGLVNVMDRYLPCNTIASYKVVATDTYIILAMSDVHSSVDNHRYILPYFKRSKSFRAKEIKILFIYYFLFQCKKKIIL